MALSLQDFNKPADIQQLRMDAFQPRTQPSPAANSATINTLASYGAALDPSGNIDGAYNSITRQLQYSSSSDTLTTILRDWDTEDVTGTENAIRDLVIDPSVSDDAKASVLQSWQLGDMAVNSLAARVAMKAAEAPNEGETGEFEDLRIRIAAGYDNVDSYNGWVQQNINALNGENNISWQNNVKAMVESFIPFTDAARQAQFQTIIEGQDVGDATRALLLLGEGKQELIDTLARIPIEERRTVVQNIINVIKSSSGPTTDNLTVMKQVQIMQQMLTPGAYDDPERWADNIFSVLDDTVLLSPFSKPLKGAARALASLGRGADGVRVAEEVIARAERVSEPLLMIEYKPSPISYGDDIDAIVDALPIEPTGAEITNLRDAIMTEVGNANFSIDNVINNANIVDKLTSTQVNDIRQAIGRIRDKRMADMNTNIPDVVPTMAEVQRQHISGNVQPTAVSQVVKDANPSQARVFHTAVVNDVKGDAARILYGTDRDSAIGHDFLPEVGGPDGRVKSKVEFDEAAPKPDEDILARTKEADAAIWASDKEKAVLTNQVKKDWKNVVGLSNRKAMGTIEDSGNGLKLKQVYGPKDGGFSNAFTAVDVVRAALGKYGVTPDEITILARQPDGNYARANPKQDMSNGDFLIQVDHDYTFDPKEIKFDGFDISKLWSFIKIPDFGDVKGKSGSHGGITQHAVPKAVNIDPRAYSAGIAADGQVASLIKQLTHYQSEMLKKWKKLPNAQKDMVDQYIRLANDEGLEFNSAKIRARGISDQGLAALIDFKTVQDTIHALENQDANRTLRNQGYEMFEHPSTNTSLLVKPVGRTTIDPKAEIYDVATDTFVVLSQKNLDELYEKGGSVVTPRNGDDFINGRPIQYILNPQSASGFSRRLRDNDPTLAYRHGYYHVRYEDPYFLTRTKDGKTTVVGRASSRRDIEIEARRRNETKDGYTYDYKHDKYTDPDAVFDNSLNAAFSAGRSSQRLRGKRLERIGSDKAIGEAGLESPIDSLTRSIASVANRTSYRNVLEADKRRWMSQFKSLLGPGIHKFPESIDDIRAGKGSNEAKHAYRYITGLQDGYANLIDDASKIFFNKVSDVSDTASSWKWVDKIGPLRKVNDAIGGVARGAAKVSVSTGARLTAFRLYLAANPLGQAILQMAPAVPIISSLNPLGWKRVIQQAAVLGAWHRGVDVSTSIKVGKYAGLSPNDMRELIKDYELSGMSAAVNAHSFMNEDFGRLANRTFVQKAAALPGRVLKPFQSIGFDFGEQTLMSLVWLSERDRLTRQLKRNTLTTSERSALYVKARNLTGDMTKAGEMPYNSNTFSVLMQFLQAPHKMAAGLILGHRGIDWKDRMKLITGYTLTFGIPAVPIIDTFVDKLMPPDNPQAREIIKGGLTNLVLNKFLTSLSGEETGVDFSGRLQPFSTKPITEFVFGMLTSNVTEMISGAAAPSLFSDGGRIGNFLKAAIAPFTPGAPVGVDEHRQLALAAMQMFTGLSNGMKAHYMLELGKITTATGAVVDDDVTFMEALMKAAGFSTIDEARYWESNKAQWEASDEIDNDVKKMVDGLLIQYTREGTDVQDLDAYVNAMSEFSRVYQNKPAMIEKLADYYMFKIGASPDDVYNKLFNSTGLYKPEQVVKIINESNMSQDQIDILMDIYNITGESYGS
jgi:hypothetical protein